MTEVAGKEDEEAVFAYVRRNNVRKSPKICKCYSRISDKYKMQKDCSPNVSS